MRNATSKAIAKVTSTPPTTPPAIAPVFDFLAESDVEAGKEDETEAASEDVEEAEDVGVKGEYLREFVSWLKDPCSLDVQE